MQVLNGYLALRSLRAARRVHGQHRATGSQRDGGERARGGRLPGAAVAVQPLPLGGVRGLREGRHFRAHDGHRTHVLQRGRPFPAVHRDLSPDGRRSRSAWLWAGAAAIEALWGPAPFIERVGIVALAFAAGLFALELLLMPPVISVLEHRNAFSSLARGLRFGIRHVMGPGRDHGGLHGPLLGGRRARFISSGGCANLLLASVLPAWLFDIGEAIPARTDRRRAHGTGGGVADAAFTFPTSATRSACRISGTSCRGRRPFPCACTGPSRRPRLRSWR